MIYFAYAIALSAVVGGAVVLAIYGYPFLSLVLIFVFSGLEFSRR